MSGSGVGSKAVVEGRLIGNTSVGSRPKAIFLMGPTASGKTGLAMALYQRYPVELVSVDSVLVYRGMDIGTAKPSLAEQALAPHHLIDVRDPVEAYDVATFIADAQSLMADISARGKVPLLVGGTMLYFKSLLTGLADLPKVDTALRQTLTEEAQSHGMLYMHRRLQALDPIAAERLHVNDSQRVLRALEVCLASGRAFSALQAEARVDQAVLAKSHYDLFSHNVLSIAMMPENRANLHGAIEARFDQMLKCGFLEEARSFFENDDISSDLPAMRSVGYRQAWLYFEGRDSLEAMRDKALAATRQLAKRQMTWLRGWPNCSQLSCDSPEFRSQAIELVDHFID